jgi:pimeloyl-ACP methyl ester carboxylesterase
MYYEIHGSGGIPLVLLHGGLGDISMFGAMLPTLAETRQIIAVEQQAHGHTADIDRPLSYEQMADDTAAALRRLNTEQADIFGFSDGGNVALQVAIQNPDLVRKLVVASPFFHPDGYYSEIHESIATITPEMFAGSPIEEAYQQVAPNPDDFPTLVEKIKELDRSFAGWPTEDIQSIAAPTLIIIGDSDVVRPEHAVELFRLLGGGTPGDLTGLPPSQLAVLPGTTHMGLFGRSDWMLSMIAPFLDAPMPEQT